MEVCGVVPFLGTMVGETSRLHSSTVRKNTFPLAHLSVIAFHEKAGRSQVDSWFFMNMVFLGRVATVAMLPSALSRSESFRSVHVGRPQYSRCCHLISDLWFHVRVKMVPGLDGKERSREP